MAQPALTVELAARVAQFERAMLQAANKTDAQLQRIENRFAKANAKLSKGLNLGQIKGFGGGSGAGLGGLVAGLGSATAAAAALAAALGAAKLIQIGDQYAVLENKLRGAGVAAEDLALRQEQLYAVAQRSRSSLEATTALYAKLTIATERMGTSSSDVLQITETLNKAFQVSGASASEAAAATLQLGQALASGVLQGDELRSIRENAPAVAQAIADELGTTIGALKKLGEEGRITSDVVVRAVLKAADDIEARYATLTPTVAQSLEMLNNAFLKTVGEAMKTSGAQEAVAEATRALIGVMPELVSLLTALVSVTAGSVKVIAGLVEGLADVYRGAKEALKPLGDFYDVLKAVSAIGQISIVFKILGLSESQQQLNGILTTLANINPAFMLGNYLRARGAKARADEEALKGMGYDGARPLGLSDGFDPATPGAPSAAGGKKGRSGPSAAELAERERRRRDQVEDQITDALIDELEAHKGINRSLEEQHAFELDRLALEQEAQDRALERKLRDGDLERADYDRLKAIQESTQAAEQSNLATKQALEIQQRDLEQLKTIADLHADLLRLQVAGAETSAERRRLELELLAIQQEERRVALERLANEKHWSDAKRDEAMAALDSIDAAERRGVLEATAGPLERLGRDAEFTTDKLEELAARGLQSLNDGLVDAIMNAKSLGDVARDVFRQIMADVIKMLTDKFVTKPATDFLDKLIDVGLAYIGGGSGGAPPPPAPGLATGTTYWKGGMAKVGEFGPERVLLPRGAAVFPTDVTRAIDSLRPEGLGGGFSLSLSVPIAIDAAGADPAAVARLQEVVAELKTDLPGQILNTVQSGLDRRQIRAPR